MKEKLLLCYLGGANQLTLCGEFTSENEMALFIQNDAAVRSKIRKKELFVLSGKVLELPWAESKHQESPE